ncbi:enoyl-CoA hydratase/isomerase family protein [Micromonospora sp. CB01531]|uniref:enoyl-CoA hydratase/isomerase family protein n=1 Tax=Micromonospora sp. CB01531 TaxID=1718947 RepID=UPI00093F76FC|nr:enoyl-CoA hydratase/isomerase family protein [Micromonospora sp. CB01531]OKI48959.1 hypothetical protein A6A27_36130 [Micromonospora sp. CB01531]
MHTDEPPVLTTTRPGALWATLNRSEAGNTLRADSLTALHRALDSAETDPACRALVLASDADAFCLGLDLRHPPLADEWHTGRADESYWRLLGRLRSTALVTIAVVNGPAAGGGVGLAAACDLLIAGRQATFRLPEVFYGLLPAMITPVLSRRIGEHRVFRMSLLAEPLDAQAAESAGLVDMVADDPHQAVRRLMAAIARTDRDTVQQLKASHRLLFSVAPDYGLYAGQLLARRLDDPKVRQRIDRLRANEDQP